MIIDFDVPQDGKPHYYCIKCHSENVKRISQNDRKLFECSNCNSISERWLVFDPQIVWWIDPKTKEYRHKSVGVLLISPDNKFLLFERNIYPFVFTMPAGHLDINEEPMVAAAREVQEEVGISLSNLDLVSEEEVADDACSRGADSHYWYLYKKNVEETEVTVREEGSNAVWLTKEEALTKELTAPLRYFLEKYF